MAITKLQSEALNLADDYTFTGELSGQNYPAFEAYLSSAQTITHNLITKVEFDTERFDTNGTYDNSTNYRFTPAIAGKYYIYSNLVYHGSAASTVYQVQAKIYKNGSQHFQSYTANHNNPLQYCPVQASCILDLDTDDYVEIYGYIDSSSGTKTMPANHNIFGAYRIGS